MRPSSGLTVAEEAFLVYCIFLMHSWGWPMRIPFLESMARDLLLSVYHLGN
jgi:hypothetical protein